jgi:hypothetical protein
MVVFECGPGGGVPECVVDTVVLLRRDVECDGLPVLLVEFASPAFCTPSCR